MAKRPQTILGISASHDASACILRDGKLEVAIQLERLTRKKHDGQGFLHSRLAADYCLAALGLKSTDVDLFAFNSQPLAPGYVGLNVPSHDVDFDLFDPFSDRTVFVSHHLAHAFAAFFCSPFESATVFVADGSGGTTVGQDDLLTSGPELAEYLSQETISRAVHVASTYSFGINGYRLIEREVAPTFNTLNGSTSLGEVYAAVSQFIFGSWQEGGKLMGLAPYGNAEHIGPTLLQRDQYGRMQFSARWKNRYRQVLRPKVPMEWRDLAARVQKDIEDAIVERVRTAVAAAGDRQLAYAGGLALNIRANQRLRSEAGLAALYIMPASHDAGIAVGAAAAAHFWSTKSTVRTAVVSDYLGYSYDESDCAKAIRRHRCHLNIPHFTLANVVDRLVAHEVVGWFEGASEFGPRSLGHRSILASAERKFIHHRINKYIKFREDFRPFAPVVPLEHAEDYFDLDEPSPYMLRTARVRPEMRARLAAVTHVDGTARVQTLDRTTNPRLYDLLIAYGKRTGIPVLLNTSLNLRGDPIVETPLEAVELLLSTHMDALVLGDNLLTPLLTTEVTCDARLSIAPNVEIRHWQTAEDVEYVLAAIARRVDYHLPKWAYDLISLMDGRASLATLLAMLQSSVREDDAYRLCKAFCDLRLLISNRV